LSPNEPGPRIYYIEPLLRNWIENKPTRFLEAACAYGYRVLTELEPQRFEDKEEQQVYKLCQAIFRNRHRGHAGMRRLFTCAADLVEFDGQGGATIVAPGFDHDQRFPRATAGGTVHRTARRLLAKAFRRDRSTPRRRRSAFSELIAAYRSQVQQPPVVVDGDSEARFFFPIQTLPGRSDLDWLYTDGLERIASHWRGNDAMAKVRSALISGPVSRQDQALAVRDPVAFRRFVRLLGRATKDRSPREFDDWLAHVREHGYLALVGGTRLRDEEREEAARQAQRIYGALAWLAYERMARCYGALMLMVFADLCLDGDREPDLEEQWQFRQRHFPQLYLAGLPLDFLAKPQLRWVLQSLTERWRNPRLAPETYDEVTDLLGLYGVLARNRREADRRQKDAAQGRSASVDPSLLEERHADNDAELLAAEDERAPRRLSSPECPACRGPLKNPQFIGRISASLWRVRLYCPGCNEEDEFELNPAELLGGGHGDD
jgi:hypothetical protein